jgi:hypothetical protein
MAIVGGATKDQNMGCTVGEIEFATRRALNLFDKWNDVTGFVPKFTSYYYEVQSCIKDAVLCGVQVGVGVHDLLPEEIENAPLNILEAGEQQATE